jgi:diguanylate cyclase (GGDEF)-like protein
MTAEGSRTLAHEVTDAFRIVIASALAMVVVLSAALIWFAVAGDPAIDQSARAVSLSQDASAGLLEEQSMLRAFIVTGDREVLTGYPGARARVDSDLQALEASAVGTQSASLVRRFSQAVGGWESGWAAQALAPSTRQSLLSPHGALSADALTSFVHSGHSSFLATQDTAQRVVLDGRAAQTRARRATVGVVAGTASLLLMIGIAAASATMHRRRQLNARVVGPIGVLLAKVQAVGRGEFGASPVLDAPLELLALRDELADMSASLKLQQQVLATRADDAAANARRLKLVVEFAREISDSLTLTHVLSAVTSAGRRLVESPRARVWLFDEESQNLALRHDSITGDVVVAMTQSIGDGGVGRAAQDHRVCYSVGLLGDRTDGATNSLAVAVPLLKGTRLIGVLEIALKAGANRLGVDTIDVLNATAGHAATAIDAALLYSLSESLSRSDPLTGLANRRQLDQDLELEVERAGRYHRPMSFLMIDIDHFKAVNDTFGHSLGDTVLREVADLLRDHMRSGDTAYRYGGEEFAVLARETDVAGGQAVAERLRRAIQERYSAVTDGDLSVTISVGLAGISAESESATDLMAAADEALYAAKRAGRNRVMVAPPAAPRVAAAEPICATG